MTHDQLAELVVSAQKGNKEALNSLLTEIYEQMYIRANRILNNEELALDVAQESALEIVSTLGSLREPKAFVFWMNRIVEHQCTRYFKKKKDLLLPEGEDEYDFFESVKEENSDFIPDESLDKDEFKKIILGIIKELPEAQQSTVWMYYFDEYSIKQIAEIQGVSENTVKSRLNYARKAIEAKILDYEKKHNTKLHGLVIAPLFSWLFDKTMSAGGSALPAAFSSSLSSVTSAASQGSVATASSAVASGNAASAAARKAAAARIATGAAAVCLAAVTFVSGVGVGKNIATSAGGSDDNGHTVSVAVSSYDIEYILENGTIYTQDEYQYKYSEELGGWNVTVADEFRENTEFSPILSEIRGAPVVAMNDTFSGVHNLTSVPEIPESIIYMNRTFKECETLVNPPEIPYGVREMESTFSGCVLLKKMPNIPSSVITMESTFWGCESLAEVTEIPNGVENMGSAFFGCESLKVTPKIGDSVKNLYNTFNNCINLETVTNIPANAENMFGTFHNCNKLTYIPMLPPTVTDISNVSPDSVEEIIAPCTAKNASFGMFVRVQRYHYDNCGH